jgi:hypothetical protein
MRPYLLVSASFLTLGILGAASLAASVASCGSSEARCTNLACQAGASYVGHVHAPFATVTGATFTFCVNDVCGTTVAPPVDAGAPDASADAGDATVGDGGGDASGDGGAVSDPGLPELDFQWNSGVYASGRVVPEPDGWVLVVAQATGTFGGTPDKPGPFQALAPGDGDRYRLAVTGADGTPLLDVRRGVNYLDSYPNGKTCDIVACKTGTINAWPTSAADVTCSGNAIVAQASFTLYPTDPVPDNSTIRVCRNDVCDVFDGFLGLGPGEQAAGGTLPGPVLASYELTNGGLKLVVIVDSDPAAVADGDHYVLSLVDPLGASLASVDTNATYTATTPNEPGCDPYPSRAFTFTAPKPAN